MPEVMVYLRSSAENRPLALLKAHCRVRLKTTKNLLMEIKMYTHLRIESLLGS